MNKQRISDYYKAIVIALGAVCFGIAVVRLPFDELGIGYIVLFVFSLAIAPSLNLVLPRSKFSVSFSDAAVFLCFLLYGGEAAIVLATVDMFATCYYLKSKNDMVFGRYMIAANTFIAATATAVTYVVWSMLPFVTHGVGIDSTRKLIYALGILTITQFIATTVLGAIIQSLKDNAPLWSTWKKHYFFSSFSLIVGAGVAGIIYKVINFADYITTGLAFLALAVAYLTYRQSVGEINVAIDQVEEAEKQKAETERVRRLEAEKHAEQLKRSLDKEEKANAALRKSERDFQYAAMHDSLTNLANRKQFGDFLRVLINEYKDEPTSTFHVLFLDIRKFKNVNDSLGHTIGDKVLMIAAKRFIKMLNPTDTVARIGGDEFAIILRGLSTVGKAQKVARRICETIEQPFSLSGNRISISVNVGIAPCDTEYNTPEEVLRDADIAMHYAKEKNSGVAVFTKELRARFLEHVRFETDLRHALDRGELSIVYQPVISLEHGTLVGFEALTRWHHSEFGLIPPNKFIPIAEECGLIIPITSWILNETTRQIVEWKKISPAYKKLVVSVNISGKHLSHGDLVEDVENALESSQLDARSLKLEITESTAMENAEHTVNVLQRLKQIGVKLSIDDFGTGYSSLSYLHRLPFDTLKIDRSFVYSVGEHGENSEILQTIISLAKNLKMRVIAEGIETDSQLSVLKNLGCDYGQGFLLSKPKPKVEAERMLYQHPNWFRLPHSGSSAVVQNAADNNLPVF